MGRGPVVAPGPPSVRPPQLLAMVFASLLTAGCSLPPPVLAAMTWLTSPGGVEARAAEARPQRSAGTATTVAIVTSPRVPVPRARPARSAVQREIGDQPRLAQRPRPAGPAAGPAAPFAWPLRGQVVAAFGPQPDGRRNDGIDIAAASPTVLAAADGTVVYAGRGLPGYGRMAIISHPGDFTTVYARTGALLVAAGDRVAQGQPIARLDGGEGVAQRLHFQLRSASNPVDPTPFLLPAEAVMASVLDPPG